MSVPSPFVSAAPKTKPSGSVPAYPLRTGDRWLTLFPFKFVTAAGAVDSALGGSRLFIEDQTGNVYRIYHPKCREDQVFIYLTSGSAEAVTIDKSNAGDGYTDITLGNATSTTFQGVLGLRFGRTFLGAIENTLDSVGRGGSLRSRNLNQLMAGYPSMMAFTLRFGVDGSSDVDPDTVEGVSPVFVEHTDVGEWTVSVAAQMNAGWVFLAENSLAPVVAALGASNEIVITAAADQNSSSFSLLAIGPSSLVSMRDMAVQNASAPRSSTIAWPMYSYHKDAYLGFFNVDIDANEDIQTTSVLPGSVYFTGDSADIMHIDVGRSVADMTTAVLKDTADGASLMADVSSLESNGLVIFDPFPVGATTFMGWVFSGTSQYR